MQATEIPFVKLVGIEDENIQLDRVVDFLEGFEEEVNYFLV